jgi:hypothetical protein
VVIGLGLGCLTPLSTIFIRSWRSVLLVDEPREPGENQLCVPPVSSLYMLRLFHHIKGRRDRDRMVVGFITT